MDCLLERKTFSGVCSITWGAEPGLLALAVCHTNIANSSMCDATVTNYFLCY